MSSKAVVLASGGMDSATCFAIACEAHDEVVPVHVDYGQQTNDLERRQAERLTEHYQQNTEAEVDDLTVVDYSPVFQHFAGGVASDRDSFVTDDGDLEEEDGRSTGYVPMRNMHLIATGAGFADVGGADALYTGVQGGDLDSYPDCRPDFVASIQAAVHNSLADDRFISVETPLLYLTKTEVLQRGEELEVPWEYTYSCYEEVQDVDDPDPCGQCPACEERTEAFNEAGLQDPFAIESNPDTL
jgi:7-cyano-7-deazaguanine synthase